MKKITHATIALIRTAVQLLASGAVTAATAAALHFFAGYGLLTVQQGAAVSAALMPFTAWAHNALEDNGMIGAWLRQPTLTKAGAARLAAKAKADADAAAARAAKRIVTVAPAAQPLTDEAKAYMDAQLASLADRLQLIVDQLPGNNPPAATVTTPVVTPQPSTPTPVENATPAVQPADAGVFPPAA